jgi:hypothetical protein
MNPDDKTPPVVTAPTTGNREADRLRRSIEAQKKAIVAHVRNCDGCQREALSHVAVALVRESINDVDRAELLGCAVLRRLRLELSQDRTALDVLLAPPVPAGNPDEGATLGGQVDK